MAYRELELTLVSARELKNVNLITRMDVYAVVSMSGDPMTRQCRAPDSSGGRNPCWNARLRYSVPPTAAAAAGRCLHVLLRAERVLGDRDIGEVIIPLGDVLGGAATVGPQPPQAASYQVRKVHRSEPRGVLNVSYRLGPVVAPVEEKPPVMAYPAMGVPSKPSPPTADVNPVGVPSKPSHPTAYDNPSPPPPPPRRPHHAGENEEDPAPAPRKGKNNGLGPLGPESPPQFCVGPYTQIIFSGRNDDVSHYVSSPRKADGARPTQGGGGGGAYYAASAQPINSPRKEDRSWPKVLDTQVGAFQAEREAAAMSPRAGPPASMLSSRSSSSSSSSNHPFTLSPSSSARSSASSPSPRHHLGHTNSPRQRPAISSPLHPSPLVSNNHSGVVS